MWDTWDIYIVIGQRLKSGKKPAKIHPTVIIQAAKQLSPTGRQRLNKTYTQVVNLDGSRPIFLAYERQEEDKKKILLIKEARYTVKK